MKEFKIKGRFLHVLENNMSYIGLMLTDDGVYVSVMYHKKLSRGSYSVSGEIANGLYIADVVHAAAF